MSILLIILGYAYRLLSFVLLLYVVFSWFVRPGSSLWNLYCTLAKLLEPLLSPFRKLLSGLTYSIGIDFSPYLLILTAGLVYRILYMVIR